MFRPVLVTVGILLLGGCSSKILNSEIANDLPAGSEVAGIPYRTPKRFIAVVYEKRTDGYKEVAKLPVTIPDPDHLYVLGFRSQALATSTVDLVLNPDNTLQQVSLKSTSAGPAALTAVGTQLNAVAVAELARQKAAETGETTAATLAIAADKAKQAADLASLQYQLLQSSTTATAEDLLKAAQKERSAKLDANEAARLAGNPPYFPDVLP
jgi:hypothetical protein